MSLTRLCPACFRGNHKQHDPRWAVRPGLLGGAVCYCKGNCMTLDLEHWPECCRHCTRLGHVFDCPVCTVEVQR